MMARYTIVLTFLILPHIIRALACPFHLNIIYLKELGICHPQGQYRLSSDTERFLSR